MCGRMAGLVQFAETVAGGANAHLAGLEGEPVAFTDDGGPLWIEQLPGEGAAGWDEGSDGTVRRDGDAARCAGG